jgi:hypothetical protein
MTKNTTIAGVAAVLALALAAHAVAEQETGTVASYTGCLKNGKLESVAVGDTPAAPCGAGQTQVRLSGGDLTSVNARPGLLGGGDNGDLELGIDPTLVQKRVAGTCRGGSISVIHEDGSVACDSDDIGPGTDAFAGFWDGPEPLPLEPNTGAPPDPVAQLTLPGGSFVVAAKLAISDLQGDDGFPNFVRCRLNAGPDFDRAFLTLDPAEDAPLALGVVHAFADPGAVVVSCAGTENANWAFLKITATRVTSLSNTPLTLIP